MLRLTLAGVALVVSVDEAAETRSVAANDNNSLADPAGDVLNVFAAGAAECVDDVDKIGCEVAEHVHVTRGRGEGHDHGGVLDKVQGLRAEGVPEVVTRATCGESRGVGLLGMGLDSGETFRAAFAWRSRWVRDGIVGGAKRRGAVGRVCSGAERRGVDEDEELGAAEVGVVEVG
jgi:hypothetical protein